MTKSSNRINSQEESDVEMSSELPLPSLTIELIFQNLDLRDLVRCRVVCKQFRFYADQTIPREVVVSGLKLGLGCWYLRKKLIDFKDSLSWNSFVWPKPYPFNLIKQLRYMHVHLPDQKHSFNYLNDFTQLVHLEICMNTRDFRMKTVSLPELRVLKLVNHLDLCTLNTPKLERLSCNHNSGIARFRIPNPETLRWLECGYTNADQMGRFCNLKVFQPNQISGLDANLLWVLKNLKELDIRRASLHLTTRYQAKRFGLFLMNIMKLRKDLKKDELKFYLDDVELISEFQLEDYFSRMGLNNFRFKHYKLLRYHDPNVIQINYNIIKSLVPELSSDFFDKFPNIMRTEARGAVDPARFAWFLSGLSKLTMLILTNTALDQTALDNLPNINDRLTNLMINEPSGLTTNFNFILRFRQLRSFETNQQFRGSFDLAEKAFLLTDFRWFLFRDGDEYVCIAKDSPYKFSYELRAYNAYRFDIENFTGFVGSEMNFNWAEMVQLWQRKKQLRGGNVAAENFFAQAPGGPVSRSFALESLLHYANRR